MLSKPLLHHLLTKVDDDPFAVTYWDGCTECYGRRQDGKPRFTLILRDPNAFTLGRDDPLMRFGEAYMQGQIDVEGDIADLVALAIRSASTLADSFLPAWVLKAVSSAAPLRRRSERGQAKDIVRHYDLGNAFFRRWLDESMTYSCAYFQTDDDSLETAQRHKVDHSLRKLRLHPDDSLLDIGCGWGALVMRAAERYDAQALGITLSKEQEAAAGAAIKSRGLEERARVRLLHYEQLAAERQTFDKIVSIGMMEHVGKAHLPEFAKTVRTLLRPGGLAMLHLITTVKEGPLNSWSEKYVFPGAYIPTLPEVLGIINANNLHIWDVENLGPHYRRTLDHWSERYESAIEPIRERHDETFVRMWRLYLRGTSACFREGSLEIHQILVSRDAPAALPLTRDDLYSGCLS